MNYTTLLHRVFYYIKYLFTAQSIYKIHSPFVYEFVKECFNKKNYYYHFQTMNDIRKKLSKDNTLIQYENIGAGSFNLNKKVKIKDILKVSVSPSKYSELYFRIALFLKSDLIIELGTSLGINAMYLAYAAKKVISIEGQKALCEFAENLFRQNHIDNVQVICSDFDTALKTISSNTPFNIALIDGNHTYQATIQYFTYLSSSFTQLPVSVIIIDDIYWSREMTKAWNEIKNTTDIKVTIDLYKCGIVIFHKNFIESQHFTIRY
ncbi:MAG: class I SAM-dependent methyltransferase [Bacteroidia bacterium]|nr:class I SAM-dependent methyltransferase [Bacteroidia bacterium]